MAQETRQTPRKPRLHTRVYHVVRARSRLFAAVLAAMLLALVLPPSWRIATRLLAAWDFGIVLYMLLVGLVIRDAGANDIKRRAARYDEGGVAILLLTCIAAAACFAAIFVELATIKADPAGASLRFWHAAVTVALSWAFTHTMFAFHYAHEYYRHTGLETQTEPVRKPCLQFPETNEPIYSDFFYFAFVIGCTAQTADVGIASRAMRKIALLHGVLSFIFNTAILALSINIGASLLSG
jgi:uncharacterized membrane protein